MSRRRIAWLIVLSVFVLGLGTASMLSDRQNLLFTLFLVFTAMIPFFVRFERREVQARELVLLAVLAAIAAVSRVPFAILPSVQPTTFVIMVTGIVFGAESGFMVGALAAVVSNIFLGQGPWTVWQMFSWGLVGCSAGLLFKYSPLRRMPLYLLFGGLWGFVFGWIMNLSFVFTQFDQLNWHNFWTANVLSFYFDLMHALSNLFFISLFSAAWLRILERYKRKYGLLQQ